MDWSHLGCEMERARARAMDRFSLLHRKKKKSKKFLLYSKSNDDALAASRSASSLPFRIPLLIFVFDVIVWWLGWLNPLHSISFLLSIRLVLNSIREHAVTQIFFTFYYYLNLLELSQRLNNNATTTSSGHLDASFDFIYNLIWD